MLFLRAGCSSFEMMCRWLCLDPDCYIDGERRYTIRTSLFDGMCQG